LKRTPEHPTKPQDLVLESQTDSLSCAPRLHVVTGAKVSEPCEEEGPAGFPGRLMTNGRSTIVVTYSTLVVTPFVYLISKERQFLSSPQDNEIYFIRQIEAAVCGHGYYKIIMPTGIREAFGSASCLTRTAGWNCCAVVASLSYYII